MASIRAGVQGTADIARNDMQMAAPPGQGGRRFDLTEPATWSKIYFLGAIAYLVGMTFAAGGFRGSAGM